MKTLSIFDHSKQAATGHWRRSELISRYLSKPHERYFAVRGQLPEELKDIRGGRARAFRTFERLKMWIHKIRPLLLIWDLKDTRLIGEAKHLKLRAIALEDWIPVPKSPGLCVINPHFFTPRNGHQECLKGPRYYPIDVAASRLRKMKRVTGRLEKILVCFGGADPLHLTGRVLNDLRRLGPWAKVTAVLGPLVDAASREKIAREAPPDAHILHRQSPKQMYRLILRSDAVITATGLTLYECAAIGTPVLLVPLNSFQERTARAFVAKGCASLWNIRRQRSKDDLSELRRFMDRPDRAASQARRAKSLIDGKGLQRIQKWVEASAR